MNLIISMFGGMALTAGLYFIARRLGQSNFWSAILATGLPCLAYMGYASRDWPGMDVLTINMISYPTVAVILYQLYGRQSAQHLHWAPKLLVSFFLVLIALLGSFVYIASNGLSPYIAEKFLPKTASNGPIHTGFSGVVEHGEEAAKGISQHLRTNAELAKIGWQVEIQGLDTLTVEKPQLVTLLLHKVDGSPIDKASISVSLSRPGQHSSAPIRLTQTGSGCYSAEMRLDATGHWLVQTSIDLADRHIRLEHHLGAE